MDYYIYKKGENMKKSMALISLLALTACSTSYHTGRIGMNAPDPVINFAPKEIKTSVDTSRKLTGSAECSSFLWVFNSTPERQAYGVAIQAGDGNLASSQCVAAAVYDALKSSDADIMYGLQYTSVRNGFLCLWDRCFSGSTKVIVKGYPGKVTAIVDKEHNNNTKDKK